MYSIDYINEKSNSVNSVWYVQNIKPALNRYCCIKTLYADGHELEHIRAMFTNIPLNRGGSCKWTGDIALFIYNNL